MRSVLGKRFVLATLCVVVLGAYETFAKAPDGKRCQQGLARSEKKPTLDVLTAQYAEAAAEWVQQHRAIPTEAQLARTLKIKTQELHSFFARKSTPNSVRELVAWARERVPEAFEALHAEMVQTASFDLKDELVLRSKSGLAKRLEVAERDFELIFGSPDNLLKEIAELASARLESAKRSMVRSYTKAARDFGRTPTMDEVALVVGLEADKLAALFGKDRLYKDLADLKNSAMTQSPESFKFVVDTDIFNEVRTEAMLKAIKSRKRLIVTTAVAGSPVNRVFLEALLDYCKRKDAEILVYPANMQTSGLDPLLLNTPGVHVITDKTLLNPWLTLNPIKILAKHINPLQGLERIGARGERQIVGSPKMHARPIPTPSMDNQEYPHLNYSTGALTDPVYDGRRYVQGRTDEIAHQDHVLGALILEKSDGHGFAPEIHVAGRYHIRRIEFLSGEQGFSDMDVFYDGDTVKQEQPEALILGDIHVGDTDATLLESLVNQVLRFNPKVVMLHDLMNGHSVSPHERDKLMTLAERAGAGMLDLRRELLQVVAFVNALLRASPGARLVVAPSNHDHWLTRYLESGQFMKEPHNTKIGLELARAVQQGEDPLEYALTRLGVDWDRERDRDAEQVPHIDEPNRVVFLRLGESFKVGPDHRKVELGLHGDRGANGAKGSIRSFQRGVDRMVFGHTHTTEWYNGVMNIATSTRRVLPYSRGGLSSWMQTLALISAHGEAMPLELIDGRWYSDVSDEQVRPADEFFLPNYPRIVPRRKSLSGVGQVDQYGG